MPFQNAIGFFSAPASTPGGTVYDYDGNLYHWITIGTQQWMVENFRSEHYADGTPIPIIGGYDDWFLPSRDELQEIYNELALFHVGDFDELDDWWCSTEFDGANGYYLDFITGIWGNALKAGNDIGSYPVRSFISSDVYSLRDTGPANGLIFIKIDNFDGTFTYYEAYNGDWWIDIGGGSLRWSNVELLIGTTGDAIGTGQANTLAIIAQAGHIASSANSINDLSGDDLWAADTTGAMCYYDNDEATYKSDYGAFYNWYAVDNAHGLAPAGWRVPSQADWATLSEFLGGDVVAGGILKEVGLTHWNTPNTGATDDYGFEGLPGGFRDGSTGIYGGIGTEGDFWTQMAGTLRIMEYSGVNLSEDSGYSEKMGFSVRMMRDTP